MGGRIFITGDIHGRAASFRQRVDKYISKPRKTDILICAGDVGLEYGDMVQGSLKKEMAKFPGTIYVMRGNHDNRYWANHTEIIETPTSYIELPNNKSWFVEKDELYQKKYPNIKYIHDEGGIYFIEGRTFVFIPGGYSVDKQYRLVTHKPYEFREQLNSIEMTILQTHVNEFLSLGGKIDYIVSHTAPLSMQKYFKHLFLNFIDQSTVDTSMEERFDEFYDEWRGKFKQWFFGHYHSTMTFNEFTMLYDNVIELK